MRIRVSRESIVCALLNDLPLVNDEHPLAVPDGTQSVCNYNRCSPLHGPVECLLNDFLTFLVEGTGGLIENKDLRVLDKGSRNGDTLFLPTG